MGGKKDCLSKIWTGIYMYYDFCKKIIEAEAWCWCQKVGRKKVTVYI